MSPAYDVVYKSLKVMVQKCGFEVDEVLRLKFNLLTPHPRYTKVNIMYLILMIAMKIKR